MLIFSQTIKSKILIFSRDIPTVQLTECPVVSIVGDAGEEMDMISRMAHLLLERMNITSMLVLIALLELMSLASIAIGKHGVAAVKLHIERDTLQHLLVKTHNI